MRCHFFSVKSKCVSDEGDRLCGKPGHSCWRRICSAANLPWVTAARCVSSAVRAILAASQAGCEIFRMSGVRADLAELSSQLEADAVAACCVRCAAQRQDQVSLVAADTDQAFEPLSSAELAGMWDVVRSYAAFERSMPYPSDSSHISMVHCLGLIWTFIGVRLDASFAGPQDQGLGPPFVVCKILATGQP